MKCFVIMPFGNPSVDATEAQRLEKIYTQWIKPCVESVEIPNSNGRKLECHRADTDLRPSDIISHIIENLADANIVIADLSGRNPNVFYELGVRHAVGVATILIADNLDDIPFDLRNQRTIPYKYDPENMVNFKENLRKAIEGILASPPKNDNPVRNFLYQREVTKLQTMTAPPGYDAVKEILTEVTNLRSELARHTLEMRDIIRSVSSSPLTHSIQSKAGAVDVQAFEGMWLASPSGSVACAKVVNGELLIPYSYGGNGKLTGHYYNCRVVGKTLFGRFEWFQSDLPHASDISGVSFYRIGPNDTLEGGWWMDDQVPEIVRQDVSRVSDTLPGMVRTVWVRMPKAKMPIWAEKYFRDGPPVKQRR